MKHCYTLLYFTALVLLGISVNINAQAQAVDTASKTNTLDMLLQEAEKSLEEPGVYLYPNPTTGPISLEVNDDSWQGATATMYNIIGEALNQRTIVLGSNSYDITSFTSGFYFLNLRKGELQKTLRFVKR